MIMRTSRTRANALFLIRGNALFLILIAVALFAALAYAVTQSGRGGGTTSREKDTLEIAQMYQYAASLQQAVQRLILVNGCTDTTLNFYSTKWKWSPPGNGYAYHNAAAPSDGSCDVFGTTGGGVTWVQPPPGITLPSSGPYPIEYGVTAQWDVRGVGTSTTTDPPYSGAATADIILISAVTLGACTAINTAEGISGMPSLTGMPTFPVAGTTDFDGDYSNFVSARAIGQGSSSALDGKWAGCMQSGVSYMFYSVLLAR